jgi:uncharacterized membrane protein YgcG
MIALALLALLGSFGEVVAAQDAAAFPDLDPAQRVYDTTGSSLTADQIAQLEAQVATLQGSGADVIVYVRAMDATPEETLDQVEALQQAWVATTGTNQDTAVAILINRDPDDGSSARAGIYVGKTYHEGNVPESEQRDIVDDELIPPLRDGDVFSSLSNGLSRLDSSIRNGPPRNAFERWSADAGSSWFAWLGFILAMPAAVGAWLLFKGRETTSRSKMSPTADRPGDLEPAVAAALALGGSQPSAAPATMLSLAERGALVIEPESEGGTFSKPRVRARLIDGSRATSAIDQALWRALEREARDDLVESKDLQRIAAKTDLLKGPVEECLREQGWKNDAASGPKTWLVVIGVVTMILAVFGIVVAAVGSAWTMLIGIVPLMAVSFAAFTMAGSYSSLTREGQETALPWKAYREGLQKAARDRMIAFDLDRVFVDVVAMNLGHAFDDRLKEAAEQGIVLSAFRDQQGAAMTMANGAPFPYWVAYSTVFSSSSGATASSGTVSGGGAGGGGGAAGST